MSVAPEIAGITSKHIAAIEQTCRETNTFLLVRPSTKETMELIDEGYATKSMDIHDKSSDWGPAAGFVPCDPAFSKALKGSPNPHLHPHPHGAALPIQLRLTEKLANPASNPKLVAADPSRSATGDKRHVKAAGGTANGPKGKVFELKKQGNGWDVSWLNGDKPVPLMVWGYRAGGEIKPVTGDYDLWMVAPHISRWSEHTQVMGIQDEHGESGATMFITHLLRKLNSACGRSDNPVFNHGAESQNYGFTQSIDPKLAMFTPCGTSRMVDIGDLPGVLVDMQSAGYLVYWNKRYGERDPELMGSAFHGSVSGGGGGSGIEQLLAEARALKDTPAGNDPLAHQLRQSPLVQKALLGRGGEAGKIQAIQQFYKTMQSELKQLSEQGKSRPLGKLNVGVDIPDSVMQKARADFDVRHKLQQELQEAMVALSEMDRGYTKSGPTAGAALAPDPAKYERWSAKNQSLLMKLEKAFGKTNSPLHFERIPGTRAYKTFAPRKTGQRVGALIEKMGLK